MLQSGNATTATHKTMSLPRLACLCVQTHYRFSLEATNRLRRYSKYHTTPSFYLQSTTLDVTKSGVVYSPLDAADVPVSMATTNEARMISKKPETKWKKVGVNSVGDFCFFCCARFFWRVFCCRAFRQFFCARSCMVPPLNAARFCMRGVAGFCCVAMRVV